MKKCPKCKTLKTFESFTKNTKYKDGLSTYCRNCRTLIDAEFYKRNIVKISKRKKQEQKERYTVNKKISDALKASTPCKDCNKYWHPCQMQFDHLLNKKYNISEMLSNHTWNTIEKEIQKCELVCANCHSLRTYNRLNGI